MEIGDSIKLKPPINQYQWVCPHVEKINSIGTFITIIAYDGNSECCGFQKCNVYCKCMGKCAMNESDFYYSRIILTEKIEKWN